MRRANPVWIVSISVCCVLVGLLGACSRKVNTDTQKPMVFFAPEAVTNVPEVYKPLYLGNLPADRLAAFRAGLPYDSISLARTTNADASPIYRVTLKTVPKTSNSNEFWVR